MTSEGRIAKWDNLKFLMMFCVVMGHTLYFFIEKDSYILKGIYLFIYTFHMPVFIFITGLFSKNTIHYKKYERVIEFLFIYIIMKFLDYLGQVLQSEIYREDFISIDYFLELKDGLSSSYDGFHLFWEDGPAWFALAVAVFLLVTMFLQEYDSRTVLILSIVLGCFGGLDNHLGNHYASMRIVTFYPVFLLGFYMDRAWLESWEKNPFRIIYKIVGWIVLLANLVFCLLGSEVLYPYINLLKGKTNYMKLGLGAYGILWRFLIYLLWIVLIMVIIEICPRRRYICSWQGQRTMSVFIWHKFLLVIVFKLFFGKYYLQYELPHFYVLAAVCIGIIIFILTTYFPEFRISKRLRK